MTKFSGFREFAILKGFPEGPVALGDGSLLVVDIRNGDLVHIVEGQEPEVVVHLGDGPNGAAVGPDGALYVCNNGGVYNFVDVHPSDLNPRAKAPQSGGKAASDKKEPTITIPDPAGPSANFSGGYIQRVCLQTFKVTKLYDNVGLLTPDDIVFDETGKFWFTDTGVQYPDKLIKGAVYRASIDGTSIQKVATPTTPHGEGFETPNGIGLSPPGESDLPDGVKTVLYVSDTVSARLWALDLDEKLTPLAGELAGMPGRVVATLPGYQWLDSLKVAADGNIVVGTLINGGLTIFDHTCKTPPKHVPFEDMMTTNLCFGGPDMKDVWVTASTTGKIFKGRSDTPGVTLHFNDLARLTLGSPVKPQLAETLVNQLYSSVGRKPEAGGMRPVHAFGVCATGHFTPSKVASRYCRAAHFDLEALIQRAKPRPDRENPAGEPDKRLGVPVTVRFSNGSGAASRRDGWSDVRGMATRFHLPDGSDTDLIAMTLREFFTSTPEQFYDFALAAEPKKFSMERPLAKIGDYLRLMLPRRDPYPGEVYRPDEGAMKYAKENPFARQAVLDAASIGAPSSYNRAAYFAVHTFIVTGAGQDANKRYVRFEWQPVDGVAPIDTTTAADANKLTENYLNDALKERLEPGPTRFLLMMTIGEDGDDFKDPARAWPPHRPRVIMGTLTLDRFMGQAAEDLSFNPMLLTDGIDASEDEVLQIRKLAYEKSSEWRDAKPCPFAKESANEG
ncbi:SMP-30/gluconolactonase/LRE family protein [Shimia biformata]|uniref:SMP-30/gluconolactonase/LRE family protein n=1 Tax=Shimia biformata TaxID=1294299 RepID=UPI001950BA62|nr:SMP-30/gluconolactonase/LRE family protein [Shimia biformata]